MDIPTSPSPTVNDQPAFIPLDHPNWKELLRPPTHKGSKAKPKPAFYGTPEHKAGLKIIRRYRQSQRMKKVTYENWIRWKEMMRHPTALSPLKHSPGAVSEKTIKWMQERTAVLLKGMTLPTLKL